MSDKKPPTLEKATAHLIDSVLAKFEDARAHDTGKPRVYVSEDDLLALRVGATVLQHMQDGHMPVRVARAGEVYRLKDVLCTLDSGEVLLVDWPHVNFLREASPAIVSASKAAQRKERENDNA